MSMPLAAGVSAVKICSSTSNKLDLPLRRADNTCIENNDMTTTEYANLNVDVVLNIRKLAENAMKRNPHMSSGAVVELILEGIEQDVFDGWDPDADK